MKTEVDRFQVSHRPYAGDGRDRLPIATLRHYRNLRRHRSTILEGIRRIAVRNINHLTRAMTRLGIRICAERAMSKRCATCCLKNREWERI